MPVADVGLIADGELAGVEVPGFDPTAGLEGVGEGAAPEVTPPWTPFGAAAASNMTKLVQFDGMQTISSRLS